MRRSWLSQKRRRGGTQTQGCAVTTSSRCKADTPISVCDCENPELAARHSKCPKTKIHFKMFLFRIFIHRSGLIFHFINAFISYLFSLLKVFYIPKWTNTDSLCVSRQSWSAGPLTHSSLLEWKSCFLGPSRSPTTVLCSPSHGFLYFAPKCQAGGTFALILKSKHLKSFMDSIWPIDSEERVLKDGLILSFCCI